MTVTGWLVGVALMWTNSSEDLPSCITVWMMSMARKYIKENNFSESIKQEREVVKPGPRVVLSSPNSHKN